MASVTRWGVHVSLGDPDASILGEDRTEPAEESCGGWHYPHVRPDDDVRWGMLIELVTEAGVTGATKPSLRGLPPFLRAT